MEFQRTHKYHATVAPYRRCRRNDPPTATSLQLKQSRKYKNHKPLQQRHKSTKNKTLPQKRPSQRKTVHRKQIHRCQQHRFSVAPATAHARHRKTKIKTTPIRATVTAEIPTETEKANKEKDKTDIKETKQKTNKVTFEQSSDLRISDRIKGARRTEN